MSEPASVSLQQDPFLRFKKIENDEISYAAGFPSYPANFSRDTFISGILAGHTELLASQIAVSSRYQGRVNNSMTGEMPGRVHHEMPGFDFSNNGDQLFTTYNACDTTSLFLIAAEGLLRLEQGTTTDFLKQRSDNIQRAVGHIMSRMDQSENLFWEAPPPNATRFGLKVTYWKDSMLPNVNHKETPVYPVTYALPHFIAARGLLSASRLLKEQQLARKAETMFRAGIAKFIRSDGFMVYQDREEALNQVSSDELHSLAYIPDKYAELLPFSAIRDRAHILETSIGYACTPESVGELITDKYHGYVVWVFEQALLHYGATKYKLQNIATTTQAVAKHIGQGQELFGINRKRDKTIKFSPKGNPQQMWSIAAAQYFAGQSNLTADHWL